MTENRWSEETIRSRIETIRENIDRYAPVPSAVTLMAVTKTVPAEAVNIAAAAGVTLFGENHGQELRDRFDSYAFGRESIHFIGTLQTNKIKYLDGRVSCVESVNSVALAEALSARFAASPMDVCLEVNIGQESAKTGVGLSEVLPLLEKAASLPGIRVRGLMCIPPEETKPGENRRYFEQMRHLFVDIKNKKSDNISMDYLSMGMTHDYIEALQEGANIIRIGSAIFGARNYNR